tara:strand:- start:6631 stop:8421 length:1791 start_codon:yes stop_codon:yes gene_type:complete
MKVPTYTRQTQPTQSTGAIPFGVTASPSALSADTRAATELGQTVMQEGLKWFESELKIRRQSELDAADNDFKSILANEKLNSQSTDPVQLLEGKNGRPSFEQGMQLKLTEFLLDPNNSLGDSVVKRRFKARALDNITSTTISVKQDARKRLVDSAVAFRLEKTEELERQAVFGNKTERAAARRELFGKTDTQGKVISLGIYEQMAKDGFILPTKALSLKQKSLETIDETNVEQRLLAADRANDANAAREVYRQILNNKFVNLDSETKQNLLERATRLETALQKRATREIDQQERRMERNKKKIQNETFNKFSKRIIALELNPEDQNVKKPTEFELQVQYEQGDLTLKQFEILRDKINDQDANQLDIERFVEIQNDILAASGVSDLEEIGNRVDSLTGKNKPFPFEFAQRLKNQINAKIARAPETKDIDFYHNRLLRYLGETDLKTYDNTKRKINDDAIFTYRDLTRLDGKDPPLKAEEAYRIVTEQYDRSVAQNLSFLAPAPFVKKYLNNKSVDSGEITKVDIEEAKKKISSNTQISQRQRMFEFETLQIIEDRLKDQVQDKDNGDPKNAKLEGKNFADKIIDYFSSNKNKPVKTN